MSALLEINNLTVAYGNIIALRDLSLSVAKGEIVAVIGPNGAGKSTLLRSIAGLMGPRTGNILFGGKSSVGLVPENLVAGGIALVPEGRHIFGSLSVEENIRLGATARKKSDRAAIEVDFERMLEMFPILKQRLKQRAGQLSGGEQQMLALARAMMAAPTLLMLDEPSLGLAPLVVKTVYDAVATLRQSGVTVLIVEQSIKLALQVADRSYVLDTGRVAASGTAAELTAMSGLESAYFGVSK
jgi:branched-chain amino acid transport system ATP-binding protein